MSIFAHPILSSNSTVNALPVTQCDKNSKLESIPTGSNEFELADDVFSTRVVNVINIEFNTIKNKEQTI